MRTLFCFPNPFHLISSHAHSRFLFFQTIAEYDLRTVKYEVKSPKCHELSLAAPPHDRISFNFRCEQEAQEWATVVMSSLREAHRGQSPFLPNTHCSFRQPQQKDGGKGKYWMPCNKVIWTFTHICCVFSRGGIHSHLQTEPGVLNCLVIYSFEQKSLSVPRWLLVNITIINLLASEGISINLPVLTCIIYLCFPTHSLIKCIQVVNRTVEW